MRKHRASHGTIPGDFACSFVDGSSGKACSSTFQTEALLHRHALSAHAGFTLQCKLCKGKFASSSALAVHTKVSHPSA